MTSYEKLDRQMAMFPEALISLGLAEQEIRKVGTLIASEARFLDSDAKESMREASPIPIKDRVAELVAFQAWMDHGRATRDPAAVRAQVVVQNYICFVYLNEACFRVLQKAVAPGSVTKRCCKFLTDNPVRSFRNAVAHANWTYREDFGGLVFWARKGASSDEEMSKFEVKQADLEFWQALSKCVAYAAYTSL